MTIWQKGMTIWQGWIGLTLISNRLFKKLNQPSLFYTTREGFIGMQATGETKGISYISLIQNLNLPNLNLSNQIVKFNKNKSSLVGNKFFENFVLSIDWDNKMLYLCPQNKVKESTLNTYKYLFALTTQKIVLNSAIIMSSINWETILQVILKYWK